MAKRYSKDFEPLLLEGENCRLMGAGIGTGGTEGLNVRCVAVGAMPELTKDFGVLTGGTWKTDQEDTNLEMGKMELGQFRMMIRSNTGLVQMRLKNPAAVQQWRTAKANFSLPPFPFEGTTFMQEFYWVQSEFFVFEDTTPRFDLYSPVATTTECYVTYHGWRMKLEPITAQGRFTIWISEWPSRSM